MRGRLPGPGAPQRAAAALAAALAAAGLAGLAAPQAARAAIPSAEKVRAAVAAANVEAGRSQPLRLDVAVVDENGSPAATGRARLDPDGHARLELTLADGRSEVHERDASGYRVTRDGAPVERTLRLLPPGQLLQAPTATEVAAALIGLRGDPDRVDLGLEGGADCWVLGGRDPGDFDRNGRPSLWVDLETLRPLRIDEGPNLHFRFGPLVAFAASGAGATGSQADSHRSVIFPSWIAIEAAGWPHWRLEVRGAAPAGPSPRGAPP